MAAAASAADAAGVLFSEEAGSDGAGACAGAGAAAGAPNLCHDTPQKGKGARRAVSKKVWNRFARQKHIHS